MFRVLFGDRRTLKHLILGRKVGDPNSGCLRDISTVKLIAGSMSNKIHCVNDLSFCSMSLPKSKPISVGAPD
jgi:hypothetical protein